MTDIQLKILLLLSKTRKTNTFSSFLKYDIICPTKPHPYPLDLGKGDGTSSCLWSLFTSLDRTSAMQKPSATQVISNLHYAHREASRECFLLICLFVCVCIYCWWISSKELSLGNGWKSESRKEFSESWVRQLEVTMRLPSLSLPLDKFGFHATITVITIHYLWTVCKIVLPSLEGLKKIWKIWF